MSPSSSAAPQALRSQTHSRKSSTAAIPQQAPTSTTRTAKPSPSDAAQETKTREPNVHYTVFIRLPFPRNGFEDPPPVDWTSAKDKQLWKLISNASNAKGLDWEVMSERFDVPLSFLLQQAAWLLDRHAEGVRAQMKRLGAGVSAAPSPKPEAQRQSDNSAMGGVSMQRKGSNEPKLPFSLNTQRGLQTGADSGSSPATPRSSKPLLSRNPSTSTVTQSRVHATSPRQGSLRAFRGSSGSQRRPPPPVQSIESSQDAGDENDESALGNDAASETDSEGERRSAPARSSRVSRRPPLGKKGAVSGAAAESDGDNEDDEEESSGDGYLPFAAAASSKAPGRDDPAATLRSSPKRQTAALHAGSSSKGKSIRSPPPPESSESSASSTHPSQQPSNAATSKSTSKPSQRGPLSPKQRAQLAQLSPRYKSGSEGSPSMGSSFSDLDELSVTQSALEEALMSNVQHGSIGMGSRMSGLRDALGRK